MDNLGSLMSGQNAALIFTFLQADCSDSAYKKELLSLGKDLNLVRDIKSNGTRIDCLDDGELETDGHLASSITVSLDDILPSVELQWPRDRGEDAALQQIAEGLREIAAQLEESVVARAIQNLNTNISASPYQQWKHHLASEVERVMRQGVGLEHLPQERVIMALTLTLVKGVCVQAPQLLRRLFTTALYYINPMRAR